MTKTIIEYRGKRYQVVKSKGTPCAGCAFLEKECECTYPLFPEHAPCIDYDIEYKSFHVLKEIKNGTK